MSERGSGSNIHEQWDHENDVSVSGGRYRDPDPGVVKWINEKFTDPDENIKATLMKAFEWAGIVKSVKEINELQKPLEYSGLLPPTTTGDEPPEFSVSNPPTSDFMERREEELLLELQEGNDSRNTLLERVKNATVRRRFLTPEEDSELIEFIHATRRETPELPPAYQILQVMVGMIKPYDQDNRLKSKPLPDTEFLAPDIYFMLLKEERESGLMQATG